MEIPFRNNPKAVLATAITAFLIMALPASLLSPQRAHAAPSFINIDLSTTLNQNDFPYGINCEDPDNVYVSLHNQGNLVKIRKSDKAILSYLNDPQGNITSGQDFYSIARDSSGNMWVNERDNGKVWKYSTIGNAWTSIPIAENLTATFNNNPKVTYPLGYESRPDVVRIDENPDPHGLHTYALSMQSFGGVISANNNIYVGLSYNLDFDSAAETNAGITDVSFSGLAKINPSTNAVTRIAISGSVAPTGMVIDSTDSTIMWITDREASKVYKYNLTLDSVLQTITLSAGSNPRGVDDDATFLYIALNKDAGGNSQILKINKVTLAQTSIDTGAPNSDGGTFTVFVANSLLLWTDQSRHVGSINLNNNNQKTFDSTVFADSNHFGCLVGSEFWWAGKGSAVVGVLDTSAITFEEENNDEDGGNDEEEPATTGSFEFKESGKVKIKENAKTRTKTIAIEVTGDYNCDGSEVVPVASSLEGTVTYKGVEYTLNNINFEHSSKRILISADIDDGSEGSIRASFELKKKGIVDCDDGLEDDQFKSKDGKLSGTIDGDRIKKPKSIKGTIEFS